MPPEIGDYITSNVLHDIWEDNETQKNRKDKPLQEGTAKRVPLDCFQWIYLHEVHNINQQPWYLKIEKRWKKRHKNMTRLYS